MEDEPEDGTVFLTLRTMLAVAFLHPARSLIHSQESRFNHYQENTHSLKNYSSTSGIIKAKTGSRLFNETLRKGNQRGGESSEGRRHTTQIIKMGENFRSKEQEHEHS